MCLGIPGQVVALEPNDLGMTMGKVAFGGIIKETCLAFVPEVAIGDYVLVHVGFAMSKIDEEHARDIFDALEQLHELQEVADAESP
jgi:hydrogenase expression/formation protein HypC